MFVNSQMVQTRLILTNPQHRRVLDDLEKLDRTKWKNKTQYIIEALDEYGRRMESNAERWQFRLKEPVQTEDGEAGSEQSALSEELAERISANLLDAVSQQIRTVIRDELRTVIREELAGFRETEQKGTVSEAASGGPEIRIDRIRKSEIAEAGSRVEDEYSRKAMELLSKWDSDD